MTEMAKTEIAAKDSIKTTIHGPSRAIVAGYAATSPQFTKPPLVSISKKKVRSNV